MALPWLTITQATQRQAAAAQGLSARPLDLRVGSVLRATFEANARLFSWLQRLTAGVLRAMRLSTAEGDDASSFVADFGLQRLPAAPATGTVTFSRFVAFGPAYVPVGGLVRTGDGSATFAVAADSANPAFDEAAQAYAMPTGTYSVDALVRSVEGGPAGNVQAGTISLMTSAMPGIDSVANAAATAGGIAAESDDELRARFPLFLGSLSKATKTAIEGAVAGVQAGLRYVVQPNVDASGAFRPGHFVVRVGDASGALPQALRAAVVAAVDEAKAVAETFSVLPPLVTTANVSLSLTVGAGDSKPVLAAQMRDAVTSYINSLGINSTLSASRLAYLAYGVDPAVQNVTGLSINGSPFDLAAPTGGVIRPGIIVVS